MAGLGFEFTIPGFKSDFSSDALPTALSDKFYSVSSILVFQIKSHSNHTSNVGNQQLDKIHFLTNLIMEGIFHLQFHWLKKEYS